MKVTYHEAARDDLIRQFRYYLVEETLPEVALRFRDAVKKTVKAISRHPAIAPPYVSAHPDLKTLRSGL